MSESSYTFSDDGVNKKILSHRIADLHADIRSLQGDIRLLRREMKIRKEKKERDEKMSLEIFKDFMAIAKKFADRASRVNEDERKQNVLDEMNYHVNLDSHLPGLYPKTIPVRMAPRKTTPLKPPTLIPQRMDSSQSRRIQRAPNISLDELYKYY